MKIALLGYGKMGRTIERLATEQGHEIVLKISDHINQYNLSQAEVAIDFSVPSAAFNNITACLKQGVPVVSGTTGWLNQYPEVVELCNELQGSFLYASNFSLGVNIFFQLNKHLAELMNDIGQYEVSIEEIHHTEKKDAPSGTAISLAQQIIERSKKTGWKLAHAEASEIPIVAKRIEQVPGTHVVSYRSLQDEINIEHIAHSRDGFALGAITAAVWIRNKQGVFSMEDVLFKKH